MIKPTKQDLEFNETFKKWQETKDKKFYDKMWFMVISCCNNLGKRLIKRNGIFGNRAISIMLEFGCCHNFTWCSNHGYSMFTHFFSSYCILTTFLKFA